MSISDIDIQTSTFGSLLRRHRLAAGLSQEALAERARMSVNGVSALERGARRTPQRETLGLLSTALELESQQREEFERAATRSSPSRTDPKSASVAAGPWPEATPSVLPLSLTSFVGREEDVAAVAALIREHRLVTLTGTGGVGKTQTALRVAAAFREQTGEEVRFVELAAVSDPTQVAVAIATGVGAQPVPERPPLETLIVYLRAGNLLLVLDNCEHVIDNVALVAERLLVRCPELKILATSREPLHVAGEQTYRLPSLRLDAAVAVFAERARAADHSFQLTAENASLVARICRGLDGIPLAIELAAARVPFLPLTVLLERLDRRFELLSGGMRTALPRQQTMRGTIDWSVALLNDAERTFMRRLAVFADGWTLEVAEAVCGYGELEPPDILGYLGSLVDKSLVTVRFAGEFAIARRDGRALEPAVVRYGFLESIRQHAREKLAEAGELEELNRRHAEWAADYGEWLSEWCFYDSDGVNGSAMFPDVFELPSRLQALQWALGSSEVILAARIAGTYPWFDSTSAALPLVEAALARIQGRGYLILEARLWTALAHTTNRTRAADAALKALALFEQTGERSHWLADARILVSLHYIWSGRYEAALESHAEWGTLSTELGAMRGGLRGAWLRIQGEILTDLGRYAEARQPLTAAIAESRFRFHWIAQMTTLAVLEACDGNIQRAIELADEAAAAVPVSERAGLEGAERGFLVNNRNNVVAFRVVFGDYEGARKAALESIDLAHRRWGGIIILTYVCLATVDALLCDARRAALLKGYIDAWYRENGDVIELVDQRMYDVMSRTLDERLGHDAKARCSVSGAALSEDQAEKIAFEIAESLRSLDTV